MRKNSVLGKGLSALIQGADLKGVPVESGSDTLVRNIPLEDIGFNPDQPRKIFNDNSLDELADSLKQVGILQPVLVRALQPGQTATSHPEATVPPGMLKYCVVAGERRVRAARRAGLAEVPALVCSYAETEALKVALLENIQRENLGAVEEAEAYRHLMDAYGATQDELAEMLGKKRSTVANILRLLNLEKPILELLASGGISRGHAKALLGMPPGPARVQLAKMCHHRGLSVRECERRAQVTSGGTRTPRRRRKKKTGPEDPVIKAFTRRAERVYGSPVTIEREKDTGKGTLSLRFYSDEDLVRLLQIMGVDTAL